VGHIVPMSQGGTDEYQNLALEHRRCNLAAGARVVPARASVVVPIDADTHALNDELNALNAKRFPPRSSPFFVQQNGATLPPVSRRTVPDWGDTVVTEPEPPDGY
jgi:hypothetical protein